MRSDLISTAWAHPADCTAAVNAPAYARTVREPMVMLQMVTGVVDAASCGLSVDGRMVVGLRLLGFGNEQDFQKKYLPQDKEIDGEDERHVGSQGF